MFFVFLLSALVLLLAYCHITFNKDAKKAMKNIPGPSELPIVGYGLTLLSYPPEGYMKIWEDLAKACGDRVKFFMANESFLLLTGAEDVEYVLSRSEFNTKSYEYYFMQSWLGLGLLTSSGERWKNRRKIITPSFHFKILENFLQVIQEQTDIFIEKLKSKSDKGVFDIYPYITHCALDIISETSMGTTVNAQQDSESEYCKAVKETCRLLINRFVSFWKRYDFLYQFSVESKQLNKYIRTLHNFTDKMIINRRKALEKNNNQETTVCYHDTDVYGGKRKLAFLDLLLQATIDGKPLSDLDIREEVDTFLFEGHDTISAAIGFTLHELSKHPDIQQKIYGEQINLFGSDNQKVFTYSDLQEMKYLEMVIKEGLRMFPSVPIIARRVLEDTYIRDIKVAKDTSILMYAPTLHNNPKHFPDPEKFIPERFTLEESSKRNPFSLIYFSAGPRNCIGQKFAMMELKVTFAKIIRNFILEPSGVNIIKMGDLVMKPLNGIQIKLKKRSL